MTDKQTFPVGTLVLAGLLVLLMLLTYALVKPKSPPSELHGVLRSEFRPLTPFQLQTHNRGPITEASLRGKWTFVFFGYLSCPDVCPNTLHELDALYRLLEDETGKQPEDMQVLFVSIDPGRDSTEKLASYVAHFNRRFIGATAGEGAIERLMRQFGVSYILEEETAAGQYLVAHSSAIFLVDPYARLMATFSQPHYAATLLSQYQKITDYYAGSG
ncbi:MAG: SCO family protein [Gammaproteobacteria bacterium]|nr:SCO family protein [Gammaproteobacteria bacterium]MDH3536748.1 SCO family protein [Gammaproteobacteria bacterium]